MTGQAGYFVSVLFYVSYVHSATGMITVIASLVANTTTIVPGSILQTYLIVLVCTRSTRPTPTSEL